MEVVVPLEVNFDLGIFGVFTLENSGKIVKKDL